MGEAAFDSWTNGETNGWYAVLLVAVMVYCTFKYLTR